jgi:hypothetical protein
MVIASGKRSSLACILSRTPSCSQRLTRLCLSVVHLELRTQALDRPYERAEARESGLRLKA